MVKIRNFLLLDEVWRVTYSHIFPKEVFDGRFQSSLIGNYKIKEMKFIDEWIRGQSVFTIHDNKDRCFQNVRPSF